MRYIHRRRKLHKPERLIIMVATNDIITAIKGARLIKSSITDKGVCDSFLHDFLPTFNDLMKDKKYLFIECEGFRWVHIYDNDEQLNVMFSNQGSHSDEDDECYVEQITKEITYNEFLKMANGKHMDFERYSTLDGDLIFDFEEEVV